MTRAQIQKVFEAAQKSSSCHQKYIQILTNIYKTAPFEDFVKFFLQFLQVTIQHTTDANKYVHRVLTFSSQFCAKITAREELDKGTHLFLSRVFERVLLWSCLETYELRCNSCHFITMVLQDIGEDVQLEVNLIDELQAVMLERLLESKVAIRLKAFKALVRLQDPLNPACPVIAAYLQGLGNPVASIRREALNVAPCARTLPRVKGRLLDVDSTVRSMAFHKCADVGPKNFKIVDRNFILTCGFRETNDSVKEVFSSYLLPKWLTDYNGKYLAFVAGLKLVALEEDLETMAYLGKELIAEFYRKHPIDDLVAVLPITDEKIVEISKLTNEITLYWNVLVGLLRESGNMEDKLEMILPELTPFCRYLDKVIKVKSLEQMDEWKCLEFQFDLLNLFQIAENYDFTDEVGRRNMQSFVTSVLLQQGFNLKLTKILVGLAQKCSSSMDFFTHDMCHLISDIREPLIEEALTPDQQRERDFKIAELRVKINILQDQQDEVVAARDYIQVQLLDNELQNCRKDLEKLQSCSGAEKVKAAKSDVETVCRCLDVLISVLESPKLEKITPPLTETKKNFVTPLLANQITEVQWRVLRCLILFSLIDKTSAEEYAKIICMPIATYRTMAVGSVATLIEGIRGVTDLVSMYGTKIISGEEEEETNDTATNLTTNQKNKRKLYSNEEQVQQPQEQSKYDNMTISYIFEIFLDMLNDDRSEVRYNAVLAIATFVKNSFALTPSMLSRILLKWYSTEKLDPKLQIPLGLLIETYMKMRDTGDVIKEAIVPTITAIVDAPRTSPLADVDVNNVLMFLAEMMNVSLTKDKLKISILDICMRIPEIRNQRIISLLAKLLCHLDMHQNTDDEIIQRVEALLEVIKDKAARRHLDFFLFKLRKPSNTTATTVNNDTTVNNNATVKRRKNRASKECIVVLEKMDLNKPELANLHTIVEEMSIDDDMRIETPTSSNDSQNIVAVTETSDSDVSTATTRRSRRLRKKRIIE